MKKTIKEDENGWFKVVNEPEVKDVVILAGIVLVMGILIIKKIMGV